MKDYNFLKDMYRDAYFPPFLVDKVKAALVEVCEKVEANSAITTEEQHQLIDQAIKNINEIGNEFYENDSELETVARESILGDVRAIIDHYQLTCDFDDATVHRDW